MAAISPTPVATDLGTAARSLAVRSGVDPDALGDLLPLLGLPGPDAPEVGTEPEDLDALAAIHEGAQSAPDRRRHGIHYTPPDVAATVVALAWTGPFDGPRRIIDPACGGGTVLLAAVRRLRSDGLTAEECLGAIHGLDRDPMAVQVARTGLALWAAGEGLTGDPLRRSVIALAGRVVVGDALRDRWPGGGGLHAVVGNPPFGGQLSRSTARDPASARRAADILGGPAGYADTAGLFLVRGLDAVVTGGRVVLLQPVSLLGSHGAAVVRARLSERGSLERVWLPGSRVFAAAVDVCAPVVSRRDPLSAPAGGQAGSSDEGAVAVSLGPEARPTSTVPASRLASAGSWAPVLAVATGVPAVDLRGPGRIGDRARVSAGFRDEFYALAPFVLDEPPHGSVGDDRHAPLITVGLIEPGRVAWGRRATRFAGRRRTAPVVDVSALRRWADGPDGDRRLAAWAEARLRPKVVVATQTRVVEAAVDDAGTWWPSVPAISVVAHAADDQEERWLLAAALTAPPVTVWAAERTGGTALAPQAIKLSARQVAAVPLPVDRDAWTEGARLLRAVAEGAAAGDDAGATRALAAAGAVLTAAHDLDRRAADEVLRWWAVRAGLSDAL